MTFKLQGNPLEADIQALILDSLGWPETETKQTKRGPRVVKTGVWLSDGAMFWRANSGGHPDKFGRIVRGNPAGTPDILGCVCGRLVGLEVKRPGCKQRPAQRRWQAWVESAGGVYAVVECVREARDVVEAVRAP